VEVTSRLECHGIGFYNYSNTKMRNKSLKV